MAVAGGVGEKQGSLILNRATQSYLSPGSTIKPGFRLRARAGARAHHARDGHGRYAVFVYRRAALAEKLRFDLQGLMNINEAVGLSTTRSPSSSSRR